MGAAYAKNSLRGRIARSRTFATNTWTIVPLPVKDNVGCPHGECKASAHV